ncbi:hypothetical protein [Psychrobacter lutiphocae]|uniref:hypothetical protein n=1 Tax=Psychrobacter lutiphocae TaxID=540500 RepID=UPI00037BB168|nr:hypothetical protein [Psychrobacter lutiphocae]
MSNSDHLDLKKITKEIESLAKILGISAGLIHLLIIAHFFYKPITHERFFSAIDWVLASIFIVSIVMLAIKIPKTLTGLNTRFTDEQLKTRTDQLLGYNSNKLKSSMALLPVFIMMLGYLYFVYYVSFIKNYSSQSFLSVGLVVLIGLLFMLWHEGKKLLTQ